MFSRGLYPHEEEIIKSIVVLMARAVENKNWVWTEKDYAYARRVIELSFGEGWVSRVVIVEDLGVVGWAAAYETTGKLWKNSVFVYDKHFKGEDNVTVEWLLQADLEAAIESHGGIPERIFQQITRKTDLTDKLSRN
jgi:hypothetical protein